MIAFLQSTVGYIASLVAAFAAGVILADFIKGLVGGIGKKG